MPSAALNRLESILHRERRQHRLTMAYVACIALITAIATAAAI